MVFRTQFTQSCRAFGRQMLYGTGVKFQVVLWVMRESVILYFYLHLYYTIIFTCFSTLDGSFPVCSLWLVTAVSTVCHSSCSESTWCVVALSKILIACSTQQVCQAHLQQSLVISNQPCSPDFWGPKSNELKHQFDLSVLINFEYTLAKYSGYLTMRKDFTKLFFCEIVTTSCASVSCLYIMFWCLTSDDIILPDIIVFFPTTIIWYKILLFFLLRELSSTFGSV
jgi:hypothetical protein